MPLPRDKPSPTTDRDPEDQCSMLPTLTPTDLLPNSSTLRTSTRTSEISSRGNNLVSSSLSNLLSSNQTSSALSSTRTSNLLRTLNSLLPSSHNLLSNLCPDSNSNLLLNNSSSLLPSSNLLSNHSNLHSSLSSLPNSHNSLLLSNNSNLLHNSHSKLLCLS